MAHPAAPEARLTTNAPGIVPGAFAAACRVDQKTSGLGVDAWRIETSACRSKR